MRSGPNPSLRLLGYLITMFDKRLAIHLAYETLLRQMYGADVFAAAFPLAKDFKEAVASRQPISHYKPKGAPAKAAQGRRRGAAGPRSRPPRRPATGRSAA